MYLLPVSGSAVYNLYAVSNHSGTTMGGHYTAYCCNPENGEWYTYNDSRYLLYFHLLHVAYISFQRSAVVFFLYQFLLLTPAPSPPSYSRILKNASNLTHSMPLISLCLTQALSTILARLNSSLFDAM